MTPRAPYPKLLCALFMTSAEELGLHGDGTDLPSALSVTRVLDTRSDPRTILGALGRGLIAPVTQAPVGRRNLASAPRGLDDSAADLIAQALDSFRRLDDRLGSAAVVRPTLELRTLVEHLSLFRMGEEVRTRLRSVSAELSQFLGWLAFDATDYSTARAYYQEGLRSSREGADHDLMSFLLGQIAILAATEGKLSEAAAVLDSHAEQVAKSSSPRTRSWFTAVEAFVQAIAGSDAASRHALERSAKHSTGPRWWICRHGSTHTTGPPS